jgi:hypothetical protein
MTSELPNIEKIRVELPTVLHLKFRGRKWRPVDLGGLIAREKFLAPLKDPRIFARAKLIDWGGGVGWPDDRDLSASTLWRMSDERMPFTNREFAGWQVRVGLSNQEAADALGLSLRTIKNIRSGAVPVSQVVSIACRAMEADPMLLAAHYAPRFAGRPKAA